MDSPEPVNERESIASDLQDQFSFPYSDFYPPIKWIDAVGVSRVKKMPGGYSSLYKIGISNEELDKPSRLKNVWISVGYGKDMGGGIELNSSEDKLSEPIDLEFRDEVAYNIDTKIFFYHHKVIQPEEILKIVEEKHMKPTKIGEGFILRQRLWFWRKFLPGLIRKVDQFLIFLLWTISGEKVKQEILSRLLFGTHQAEIKKGIKSGDVEFEKFKTMEFFGYHAKRWSVLFYCGLHLIIFVVLFIYDIRPRGLPNLLESNFPLLCYIVVSFAVTEALLPKGIKWVIGMTPKMFRYVSFKSIKV